MHAPEETKSCCHQPEAHTPGSEAIGRRTEDLTGKYICPMCPDVVEDKPVPCPHCGMALERVQPAIFDQRVEYTCPMHPEVRRDSPGDCPICGMALEPVASAEAGLNEDPEYRDMHRRFVVAVALALPLLLVAMGDMLPGTRVPWEQTTLPHAAILLRSVRSGTVTSVATEQVFRSHLPAVTDLCVKLRPGQAVERFSHGGHVFGYCVVELSNGIEFDAMVSRVLDALKITF